MTKIRAAAIASKVATLSCLQRQHERRVRNPVHKIGRWLLDSGLLWKMAIGGEKNKTQKVKAFKLPTIMRPSASIFNFKREVSYEY